MFFLLHFYTKKCTYPYHEDRFPDVTDAVVHQTGCINELILLKGLGGIRTQCLNSYLHLLSKTGHDCREETGKEAERRKKRQIGELCLLHFLGNRMNESLTIRKAVA